MSAHDFSSVPAAFDAEPPVAESVALRAVQWFVALQSEAATASLHRECQLWRASHPDHERAWRQLESFGAQLRSVDPRFAHGVLTSNVTSSKAEADQKRRRSIKALSLLLFGASGAWWAEQRIPWRDWAADYRTGTGESKTIVLADGSRLMLNTDTAANARFGQGQRTIELVQGEIFLRMAPALDGRAAAAAFPLHVKTVAGELLSPQAHFAVRQFNQAREVRVNVQQGTLGVRPLDAPAVAKWLVAGEQARFTRERIVDSGPADPDMLAWTSGMLVVHDMPLTAFVAELGRYRPGHLSCDPALAALRVSGIYPLNDPDQVLDMLERTLPIKIHQLTAYWLTLRPRRSA